MGQVDEKNQQTSTTSTSSNFVTYGKNVKEIDDSSHWSIFTSEAPNVSI